MIVILIYIFNIAYGLILGPLPFYYCAEMLNINGLSIIYGANWLIAASVGFGISKVDQKPENLVYVISSFGFLSFLGIFFVIYFVKETSYLNSNEINMIFSDDKIDPTELIKRRETETENIIKKQILSRNMS